MEIRNLTVDDVFTVAPIFVKVTRGAQVQLLTALTGKKVNAMQVGMAVIQGLLMEAEGDVKAWFADLAGMPPDEFKAQPAGMVLDLIETLAKKDDLMDFFERVSRLVSGRKP